MRSGDGDYTLSLKLYAIIFFLCSLALNASEYYISYRYTVKDAILYNETLQISKSMQKCNGIAYQSTDLEITKDKDDLKDIISNNFEEFTQFINTIGLNINNYDETKNSVNRSTTIVTLKTTCFKVDFNDNFARIFALK